MHALRERLPSYSVYGAVLINATVTVVFIIAAAGGPIDRVLFVRLAQLNSLAFAVYALPWLSTRRRWLAPTRPVPALAATPVKRQAHEREIAG